MVTVLLEALGNVRADESGAASDADLGPLSGGQGEGLVVGHICFVCWLCFFSGLKISDGKEKDSDELTENITRVD